MMTFFIAVIAFFLFIMVSMMLCKWFPELAKIITAGFIVTVLFVSFYVNDSSNSENDKIQNKQTVSDISSQANVAKTEINNQQDQSITPENPLSDPVPTEISREDSKEAKDKTTWTGSWGNDIVALVNTEPCPDLDFLKEGYTYLMTSSIPVSRLNKPSHAYFISGDRAITVMGCWYKK
jgi:hypothetical protein